MTPISALGLDIGRRRVGVAGCDGTGLIATGLTTLQRRSFVELVTDIQQIAKTRQAQVLVVGLPLTMGGEEGFQARQVRKVAEGLRQALGLSVVYMDERLSSVEAEQLMRAAGHSVANEKALIDRKAAAIILQRWLDERRSPSAHRK
ncbi:Holliday junction resolvase RuvX [Nodosilinea sp. LEGE 07298]|uniref:Holliday junction resolvase RuvX n=1 Tax=Nodosilinea sp. LEGE 07298 TaxID=2777970 RepID=UPI0018815515|nr:Holliday junction resolvase RuvX [Nodosilinea sp. LEGE 07298]MBE9110407.1 Holliday junction resolvase RuvX [Nodosilinea sp. LEGE 07298]